MLRLTPIALILATVLPATVVLAPASSAAADDCMCLPAELSWSTSLSDRLALIQSEEGDRPVFDRRLLDESAFADALFAEGLVAEGLFVEQSREVGPFFSSDGTLISSRLPSVAKQGRRGSPIEVAWCVSANDPRCSSGDPAPGESLLSGKLSHGAALTPEPPELPEPLLASTSPRAVLLGASAGHSSRLERPPRA